jgi:hypothetical protein
MKSLDSDEKKLLHSSVEVIKWLDHSAEKDWALVEHLKTDPKEIISVGIVVKETEDVLLLAATVSDTSLPVEEWIVAEVTMILKAVMVSRTLIKELEK